MEIPEIGYNPLTKTTENIKEWLKENKDNIIFIFKDKPDMPVCLNRVIFKTVPSNYILHKCEKSDRFYAKKYPIKGMRFVDIEKFNLLSSTAIKYDAFLSAIKSKHRAFLIRAGAARLELFNEDVMFNINNFNDVLLKYSYRFDRKINGHLRDGAETTETIKEYIRTLDKCFAEYAPRTTAGQKWVVFRGMTKTYDVKKGDTILLPYFISTSLDIKAAEQFTNRFFDSHTHKMTTGCCLYELELDGDIPWIDMAKSTRFKDESEILLPRNLVAKYVGDYTTAGKPLIRKLFITKSTPDQFETITRMECQDFTEAYIEEIPIPTLVGAATAATKKRCPKGSRKNPKTGECVSTAAAAAATTKKKLPTAARCPKGSRKNRKTGECIKTGAAAAAAAQPRLSEDDIENIIQDYLLADDEDEDFIRDKLKELTYDINYIGCYNATQGFDSDSDFGKPYSPELFYKQALEKVYCYKKFREPF